MIDLHKLGREAGFRIKGKKISGWDESRLNKERDPWLMILPGRHGHVYVHGKNQLAFATTRQRAMKLKATIPGVRYLQEGDDGINAAFPTPHLKAVGRAIGLYRIKKMSPEARAEASERLRANRK